MQNAKGVVVRRSYHPVEETINLLQAYLQQHDATIYVRIDQQTEAAKVGLTLSPLQFVMFGNPKSGAPVMQQNPLAALDLPLKIIAWEDEAGLVWIACNEAVYLKERFSLPDNLVSPLSLDNIINAALKI